MCTACVRSGPGMLWLANFCEALALSLDGSQRGCPEHGRLGIVELRFQGISQSTSPVCSCTPHLPVVPFTSQRRCLRRSWRRKTLAARLEDPRHTTSSPLR
eukprot:Skav231184  [mRNA]  locus=scaffold425:83796:94132:+ [translate_table: standard]